MDVKLVGCRDARYFLLAVGVIGDFLQGEPGVPASPHLCSDLLPLADWGACARVMPILHPL